MDEGYAVPNDELRGGCRTRGNPREVCLAVGSVECSDGPKETMVHPYMRAHVTLASFVLGDRDGRPFKLVCFWLGDSDGDWAMRCLRGW